MRILISVSILTSMLIMAGISGCGNGSSAPEGGDSNVVDSNAVASNPTETPLGTWLKIPAGFSVDTNSYFDSAKATTIQIILPVSGIASLDQRIRDEAESHKKEFLSSVEPLETSNGEEPGHGNDFMMELISVYASDKVVSYTFYISYYNAGAAHPMSELYSYNYDKSTGQEITFNDYFNIQSAADTIWLKDLITKKINMEGVEVTEIRDIDFSVWQDSVSFNFDNYQVGPYAVGLQQAPFAKKELDSRIREKYR